MLAMVEDASGSEDAAEVARRIAQFAEEARSASPLYAWLAPSVAADRELVALLLAAPPVQRRANLLFAAAHDALLADPGHPLASYYPSVGGKRPPDDAALAAFRDLCLSRADSLRARIATRNTQTNEVRRSAAFLPLFVEISGGGPFALVEVGASAGLNLLVDHYRYRYGDGPWHGPKDSPVAIECAVRGAPPPVRGALGRVAHRVGVDTHPLDARDPADARWLEACVWPERVERLELLRRALAIARSHPPPLVRGDALAVLEDVVARIPAGLPVCVFHSATLFYFSDEERERFMQTLDRVAQTRTLHWLSFEGGAWQTFGARLPFDRLDVRRPTDRPTDIFGLVGHARWRDGEREDRLLARADMHGGWIEWTA